MSTPTGGPMPDARREGMTAEDAARLERDLRVTPMDAEQRSLTKRALATYHALAASQQEVEALKAKVGRLQTSVLEGAILKSQAEQRLNACEMVRDMHLAECDALRAQLAAAREDSARWQFARSRGVILFDQRQRRDTFLFDKVADAALDTARSTDAERRGTE